MKRFSLYKFNQTPIPEPLGTVVLAINTVLFFIMLYYAFLLAIFVAL